MIKKKTTYHPFNIVILLKYMIAFSFLLFVVIKPIVTISNLFADAKYEMFDSIESDTTEEKENMADDENEKFYDLLAISSTIFQRQSLSLYTAQKHFLGVEPDVYLPPPRL